MNPELAVEERLRRLESQVRRARMWSVATTVALGAVVLASMQAPQAKESRSDTLVARELRIVDEKGVTRATLGPDNSNPSEVSLDLRSKDWRKGPMARIRVGERSAQLDLGGDGLPAAVSMENDERGAYVSLGARVDEKDTVKNSVAQLSTSGHSGSLQLSRVRKFRMDDVPGHPEGVPAYEQTPSVLLSADNEYRYVTQ